MQNNTSTRRFSVLILTMYLTLLIGLSVVTATENKQTSTQVVAGQQESPASTKHSTPKRDGIVPKKGTPPTIRDTARVWFHIHIDGYHEEWLCIDEIIHRESRWIPNLWNSQGSDAYGLGQVKGSYKYTKNKPMKQFKVAVRYALHKYQTLCNALKHHNQKGWY